MHNSDLGPLTTTHVMNLSIINGVVPNELKVVKVVPIYKSGDRRLINSYRPVSVLPCFSKILEKLMYNRISNFIHKHGLLNEYQFGFRQKLSTNQALIVLLDKITAALDKGDIVLGVFVIDVCLVDSVIVYNHFFFTSIQKRTGCSAWLCVPRTS